MPEASLAVETLDDLESKELPREASLSTELLGCGNDLLTVAAVFAPPRPMALIYETLNIVEQSFINSLLPRALIGQAGLKGKNPLLHLSIRKRTGLDRILKFPQLLLKDSKLLSLELECGLALLNEDLQELDRCGHLLFFWEYTLVGGTNSKG